MSSEIALQITDLAKVYALFGRPQDRLKQMIFRGRRKYYQDFWAIRNLDLEVYKGEVLGILGRNGSGKSTLLEMICGNVTPTAGEIRVYGSISALLELGAGFNPEFSGRENIYLNATVLGLALEEIEDRLEDIIAFADIGEFLDQPVKIYSSGMYARLAFAIAINVSPDILVVDEALAVGDAAFQRKCYAKIEEIKKSGCTILFVSHSTSLMLDLCDRAVLLNGGECLFVGETKRAVGYYQKLIYATPANVIQVENELRNEISALSEGGSSTDSIERQMTFSETDEELTDQKKDYYDPNIKSASVIRYPETGARIDNPRIYTEDERKVNTVLTGSEYTFSYDVTFSDGFENVRFYNLIKTKTGIELGGGTYPETGKAGISVRKADRLSVMFNFKCTLGPGVYFFNCGVVSNETEPLHRLIDGLMFTVQKRDGCFSFGVVDFDYRPIIRHTEGKGAQLEADGNDAMS